MRHTYVLPDGKRAVIKHIKGNDFRIYAYLVTRADDYGRCFPSVALIADETGITERNVQKHLANLEDAGWIKKNFRTNTSTMYQLYYVDTSGTLGKTAKHKKSGTSKTDRSGMSKSDRSGVSESDAQTDHLTDHTTNHNNSVVSVSVVNVDAKPSSVGLKLSQEQKNDFEELWRKYRQDGESNFRRISS